jgi:transposase
MPARENANSARYSPSSAAMRAKGSPDGYRSPSVAPRRSPEIMTRAVVRLLTAPYGRRTAVARTLAGECGVGFRTIYGWRERYQKHGPSAFAHSRADKGVPRIYSVDEFQNVIGAAARLRQVGGRINREWRKLSLPGSVETFRVWVRRVQIGFAKAPWEREKVSA